MALKTHSYVIANATSALGAPLARKLLEQNASLILGGKDYAKLEHTRKSFETDFPDKCQVSLLEPSKEIDWQELLKTLQQNKNTLNGIIMIHEIEGVFQSIDQVEYETLKDIVDDHIWGTMLGMRKLDPLFDDDASIDIINVLTAVDAKVKDADLYHMLYGALEGLIRSISKRTESQSLNVYLHHDTDHDSVDFVMNALR